MNHEIEKIFQTSNSNEELFDAFNWALKTEVKDINIYKTLLANPSLTSEELKMYSETLAKVFSNHAHEIYYWTGQIFEITDSKSTMLDDAINYYIKAWKTNCENELPLLNLLKIYDHEINRQHNNFILNIIEEALPTVKKKSPVYYALAELYSKKGNVELKRKYMALAEKASLNGF